MYLFYFQVIVNNKMILHYVLLFYIYNSLIVSEIVVRILYYAWSHIFYHFQDGVPMACQFNRGNFNGYFFIIVQ